MPAVGAVLLAVITAFASGLGTRLADSIGTEEVPLVSYSVELLPGKCRGGEFVPRSSLPTVFSSASAYDWSVLERQRGAAQADMNPVQVAIQGGSGRTITLTRIEFHVERHRRPAGAAFSGACGDAYTGRSVAVDLDRRPPRIVHSNAITAAAFDARASDGLRPSLPIRFPWTVSVSDPLLLEILATTSACDCTWTAEIPWVSGSAHGTIAVDNDGAGYRVVGTHGLPSYTPYAGRWRNWGL